MGLQRFAWVAVITIGFAVSSLAIDSTSTSIVPHLSSHTLQKHDVDLTAPLLQDFQVYPPVLIASSNGSLSLTDGSSTTTDVAPVSNATSCQEVLMVYSFANSYGAPFVGNYTPPSCSFNRITLNFTVTSAGRQFDRLGTLYFGDTEIWRTSTAEPTSIGIRWTYLKDVTNYLTLFQQQQKIIFDLGNLINNIYTAPYNATLTASFFTAGDSDPPADLIFPVSARQSASNAPSVFTFPVDNATNTLTLPQNIRRAVFTIAACGQAEEEFWWSNVLSSDTQTFPQTGALYGFSPFRELQLFIDGMLAGVAWPFPIIFTGGVVPGLWRPIVGIDAFDLREDEIDITPFLPLLCDGAAHSFEIRVSGINDTGNGTGVLAETVGSNWPVTGKIFLWLDPEGSVTTGSGPLATTPDPVFQLSSSVGKLPNGTNETLTYQVNAQRSISFVSTINTANGSQTASWSQNLTYSNFGNFTAAGNTQVNNQSTSGEDLSSLNYSRSLNYPLYAFSVYGTVRDNITIFANVLRGRDVQTIGQAVFPTGLESFEPVEAVQNQYPAFQGSLLQTTQNGTATYFSNQTSNTSFSFGTTVQDMVFAGVVTSDSGNAESPPQVVSTSELFRRHVEADNSTVIEDDETVIGHSIRPAHFNSPSMNDFAGSGTRSMLGRGPPGSKAASRRK
ncbi:hypothetical protein EV356DRAFT_445452 [Viridothelium virens]|uniref:Peptide N-acetyl-beta-D-glucosaminyl asparaginase amidase A N-terminal domain-containing protein n=1 Tax=Viridothelium virens TaxID=1048519 RepID=A0A6A6HBD1_VIRVR|nr:hypothetical protein EV356DRAFT_445452 [Viridothelium virens]